MCFFWKRRKQKKLEEAQKQEALRKESMKTEVDEVPITPAVVEPASVPENKPQPLTAEPEKVEPIPKEEPENIKKQEPAEPPKETSARYSGKYEIYPEAGGYKFRLKASNGEILVVSQTYASKAGANSGIETFKKNVQDGFFEFYTDKSNFTQFLLYTSNKSRLIATGEFYESLARAQSAAESVKKFYTSTKINQLDAIDPEDIREELIELKPIDSSINGKFEFEIINDETVFRLKASNGEVLFESSGYKTKSSAYQGLEAVKQAIEANQFRVMKDKQNRYQFKIFSANKAILITGETYPSEEGCFSALDSVRRFYKQAKIVE